MSTCNEKVLSDGIAAILERQHSWSRDCIEAHIERGKIVWDVQEQTAMLCATPEKAQRLFGENLREMTEADCKQVSESLRIYCLSNIKEADFIFDILGHSQERFLKVIGSTGIRAKMDKKKNRLDYSSKNLVRARRVLEDYHNNPNLSMYSKDEWKDTVRVKIALLPPSADKKTDPLDVYRERLADPDLSIESRLLIWETNPSLDPGERVPAIISSAVENSLDVATNLSYANRTKWIAQLASAVDDLTTPFEVERYEIKQATNLQAEAEADRQKTAEILRLKVDAIQLEAEAERIHVAEAEAENYRERAIKAEIALAEMSAQADKNLATYGEKAEAEAEADRKPKPKK